jgi:hypothetical protein
MQRVGPIHRPTATASEPSTKVRRPAKHTPAGAAGTLLSLQRTAGNAAVNALLRNGAETPGSDAAPVIRRLMSFSSFQKATGQKTKRRLGGVRAALGGRKHKIDQAMQDLVTGQGNEYRVPVDRRPAAPPASPSTICSSRPRRTRLRWNRS